MNKDNGGPAFPATFEEMARYAETGYWSAAHGMTLRDYFAAKALPHCLRDANAQPYEVCAAEAYSIADAMLKERAA